MVSISLVPTATQYQLIVESYTYAGVTLWSGNYNVISNNLIYNANGGNPDGIRFSFDNLNNLVSNNNIRDVTCGGGPYYGIDVGAAATTDTYISGNEITGSWTAEVNDSGTRTTFQHRDLFEVENLSVLTTENVGLFNHTATYTATAGLSGNLINLNRDLTVNDALATLTVSGDLANLTSNCTETLGICADTGNILELNQQYTSASGAVLNILNSGSGADIALANNETIDNSTDDYIEFQGGSGTDNTDFRINLDGTRPILDSPTDALIDIQEELEINLDGGAVTTEALCGNQPDGDAGDTANVLISDCSGAPTADYAEIYPTASDVEYGDLVVTGTNIVQIKAVENGRIVEDQTEPLVELVKSSNPYQTTIIGVSSNNYGDFSSIGHGRVNKADHPLPIALNGRVPLKVSAENGAISPGDSLTSSSTPGVAMKATKSGPIVGKALESYGGSGTGKIMVFVNVGWYVEPVNNHQESGNSLSQIDTDSLSANTINTQVLFIGDRKLSMADDGSLVVNGDLNILGNLSVAGDLKIEGVLNAREVATDKLTINNDDPVQGKKYSSSIGRDTIKVG